VLSLRNAWTMPQERYNTDWVLETGVGLVGRSLRQIGPHVGELLERLDEFRAAVRQQHNRAVFEVPALLAGILDRAGAAADRRCHMSGAESIAGSFREPESTTWSTPLNTTIR
jgi:1,2-diacylglycerol 3-beta-galactosyltransferase